MRVCLVSEYGRGPLLVCRVPLTPNSKSPGQSFLLPIKPGCRRDKRPSCLSHYLINDTKATHPLVERSRMPPRLTYFSFLLFLLGSPVAAHKHHSALKEAANAPVDSILWIHIVLQTIVWGILFPVGMVLGLTKSRWHVPLQVCGFPRPLFFNKKN